MKLSYPLFFLYSYKIIVLSITPECSYDQYIIIEETYIAYIKL